MITFLVATFGSFVIYLLLVAGSGDGDTIFQQLFSVEEIIVGVVLSVITGGLTRLILGKAENLKMVSPVKWAMFLIYAIGPFFIAMAKANIDVAYRVITRNIRPGIVRIPSGCKTALGRTILANSITLTPGTLTVDIDDEKGDLFVHWINVKDVKTKEERVEKVCGSFPGWARRLTE